MAQKQILILAVSGALAKKLANNLQIPWDQCEFLNESNYESVFKLKGQYFDTVILHESFKAFKNGQFLLSELKYYTRSTSKIFNVKEEKNA